MLVEIFTDGACRGNPGLGGWGALLCYPSEEKMLYGAEALTTNNRMELMAPWMALKALRGKYQIRVTTDSQYVKKGMTEWLPNWERRGWRTAANTPVKNSDLWRQLLIETRCHQVEWIWVRGHAGHLENERADRLANQAIDEWIAAHGRKY